MPTDAEVRYGTLQEHFFPEATDEEKRHEMNRNGQFSADEIAKMRTRGWRST